jgi:hypothetical protein
MVPKIHAKGSSFVGLGKYVLHDKDGAETSQRVEWTQTRNLATQDPELAFRLMAATAMDAERLKANAGVKNTGRKSNKSVLHVTLAWHPDEGEDLTREEMMRAADLAIRALGAQDRQAVIVSHNDELQKHLHLVIGRVSPDDGRMLSSSKEKLRLSRFALEYERERGEILCEDRALNWEARDRGEYTRGEKDTPRHIYERHIANDDRPGSAEHHRWQREKDRVVGKEQQTIRDKQAVAWAKLQSDHKARRAKIFAHQKRETHKARNAIREEYKATHWKQIFHEHLAELRAFERDEKSFLGRMKNRVRAIDFKELVRSDDRRKSISDAFTALSSSGARLQWLKQNQAKREKALKAEQRDKENAAARMIREDTRAELTKARQAFTAERAALAFRCTGEAAKLKVQWKTRRQQRESAAIEWDRSHGRPDKPQTLGEAQRAMEAFKKANRGRKPRNRDQEHER